MISQESALIIVAIIVISIGLWAVFGREDCTACMYECSIEGNDKSACAKRCIARGLSCPAAVHASSILGHGGHGIQRHGLGYGGHGIQRHGLGYGGGGIQRHGLGYGGGGIQRHHAMGYGASVQGQDPAQGPAQAAPAPAAPAPAPAGSADSLESDHLAYGIGESPYYG